MGHRITAMKMRSIFPWLLTLVLLFVGTQADAQCAMCTKAAMDGLKDGNTASAGLNTGILYIVSFPYILAVLIAVAFFYYKRKDKREEQELAI